MRWFTLKCDRSLVCAVLGLSVIGSAVSAADELSFQPLTSVQLEHRARTANDSRTAAAATEKLAYSNTLGTFAVPLPNPPNNVYGLADDLTLLIQAGCALTRYTFEVVGVADPSGPGGDFRIDYALYDNCPGAGGVAIPGTGGFVQFSQATHGPGFDTVIQPIEALPSSPVTLNPTVWLRVTANRANVGVVIGAPALIGYSGDTIDFPGFACYANAGGFPSQPHASFNAQVWVDAACADAFPGYRDIQPGYGGFTEGTNKCMADDVRLNVGTCAMVALEANVRGVGLYKFDLRQDGGGIPGAVLPGTNRSASVPAGASGARTLRFTFDPPVNLPPDPAGIKVWVTFQGNSPGAGWILTRQNAQIGDTSDTYGRSLSGADCATVTDWELVPPGPPVWDAFDVQIYCSGSPPAGACCDQYVRSDEDRPVCRDVPAINCTRGLEWVVGSACALHPFEAPCATGSPCAFNAQCDDGNPCTVDVCVFAECQNILDDLVCDDGLFCNGAESCEQCPELDRCCFQAGLCLPDYPRSECLRLGGTPDCIEFHCAPGTPVSCPDDGVACTIDHCDENAQSCVSTPSEALCSDGIFCNGVERCDLATGCRPALRAPCPANLCDEANDRCRIRPGALLQPGGGPK